MRISESVESAPADPYRFAGSFCPAETYACADDLCIACGHLNFTKGPIRDADDEGGKRERMDDVVHGSCVRHDLGSGHQGNPCAQEQALYANLTNARCGWKSLRRYRA